MNEIFNQNFTKLSYKNSDKKSGVIIEEMQKGYKIADRLLRPAMVLSQKVLKKKRKFMKNNELD